MEEMLFVIRKERGMVERLRGYLGWKDVRKRTKEPGSIGGGGNGNVEEEEGMVDGIEEPGKPSTLSLSRIREFRATDYIGEMNVHV